MTTKTVYLYDADSIYISEYQATANLDGGFLEPVDSTEIAPPTFSKNQAAKFLNGAWEIIPDFRGATWYDQTTGHPTFIESVGMPPPNLVADMPLAQTIKAYELAAQLNLDSVAQSWGYDSLLSATSYVNSTVAQYKLEATILVAWRDAYWQAAYEIESAVIAGTQTLPLTAGAFIALLPVTPARPT